ADGWGDVVVLWRSRPKKTLRSQCCVLYRRPSEGAGWSGYALTQHKDRNRLQAWNRSPAPSGGVRGNERRRFAMDVQKRTPKSSGGRADPPVGDSRIGRAVVESFGYP